jgi:hypothetical protein
MKVKGFILIALVSMLYLTFFTQSGTAWSWGLGVKRKSNTNSCGHGDKQCNDGFMKRKVCYNVKTHSCVRDEKKYGKKKLCGKKDKSCNGHCFNAMKYKCNRKGKIVEKHNGGNNDNGNEKKKCKLLRKKYIGLKLKLLKELKKVKKVLKKIK